jgi:hypothetical protein
VRIYEKEDFMKKFGNLNLFGLIAILIGGLIFIGMNSLDAKKGRKKPPKWQWQVGIPNSGTASSLLCNVYGNSSRISGDYAVFENNDFIRMGVQRCEDSETGDIFYHVYFRVYYNNEGYSIGLQNLEFCGCKTWCGEDSWCCVFPPEALSPEAPCSVPCSDPVIYCPDERCGGGTGYKCMQDFMENDHPDFGYEVIAIRMYIFYDIENILPGHSVATDGQMWSFDIWNTSAPLINGNEEYHNIVCKYLHSSFDEGVNNLEGVEIIRSSDGNTWTVIVNQDGSPSSIPGLDKKLLAFREFYNKAVKKYKGKSGKYVLDSEDCTPLAGRTEFKFISRWTRF